MNPLQLTRRFLLTSTLALTATLCAVYASGPEAGAHVTSPEQCRQQAIAQALEVKPATPAEVAAYRAACNRAAAKHAADHRLQLHTTRCLEVPRSGMSRATCRALAQAAIDRRRPAWAWNRALHELLRRESTWNPNAVNDASEACGLFQRLVKRSQSPGRGCPWKVSGVGTKRERVHRAPIQQARNGIDYIVQRPGYGTPEKALAFHNAYGWY